MASNGPPAVTSAIKYFLTNFSPNSPDLAALYTPDMEVQVNVQRLDGEPVEGRRNTYEDGETRWWSIRIPKGANKEPNFKDYPLTFSLEKYAHAIGMTGWDWVNRVSRFVAYDFDSIVGHAPGVGVSDEELQAVQEAVKNIPWIETRYSTGGSGLHLYVHLKNPPETATHTEHAALARAILGVMAKEAAFDLASSMDVCGNIIWCFRTDILDGKSRGLKLIKPATEKFDKVPVNWRDNVDVIARRKQHIRVQGLLGNEQDTTPFEELAQARRRIALEPSHKTFMEDLENSGYSTVWVADHWLLQTHTVAIKELYEKYAAEGRALKGFFDTLSGGGDPSKPNCFMFPMPGGAWRIFRFGIGAVEHDLWEQAPNGWTQCYFNQEPSLSDAAKAIGAIEDGDKPGTFIFETGAAALQAIEALGKTVTLPEALQSRQTSLNMSKGGRVHIKVTKDKTDEESGLKVPGWLAKKNHWTRLETVTTPDVAFSPEHYQHDNYIRCCWQSGGEGGWALYTQDTWLVVKKDTARTSFRGLGYSGADVERLLGEATNDGWTLTTVPFAEEHPGGRIWNRFAPQWVYQPADIPLDEEPYHPHWDKVLSHSGDELNQVLKNNSWAQQNGIFTGGDYLRLWIASALRDPVSHLPYLFLWGPQASGKSILIEAISLLVSSQVVDAVPAITSQSGFNSELEGAVFAKVEEVDLKKAGTRAYNRVKDWTTSNTFMVHRKGQQPYTITNYLKLIQTANSLSYSPILSGGDKRITSIFVPKLPLDKHGNSTEIPQPVLLKHLQAEAPHFMVSVMRTIFPEMTTRLRVPVVETSSKQIISEASMDTLQTFLAESCYHYPGKMVPYKTFSENFHATLSAVESASWPKKDIIRGLPFPFVKGYSAHKEASIGNMSFTPPPEASCLDEMSFFILTENNTLKLCTKDIEDDRS